jgi:predicted secreted protein
MADTGRDLLILKNNVAIAGAQENGITVDNSPVNITTMSDDGFRTLADFAGERSLDISINGIWLDDVVRAQALGSSLLLTDISIDFADGGELTGDFYLANYTETGTHTNAVTFNATLQSSGEWTYAAAST